MVAHIIVKSVLSLHSLFDVKIFTALTRPEAGCLEALVEVEIGGEATWFEENDFGITSSGGSEITQSTSFP